MVIEKEHKPHSTSRASPGLHFARHKHFMGISGVSNPSCSVGGVRSFLSTHTPASRQGLGEEINLFFVYSSLFNPNCHGVTLTWKSEGLPGRPDSPFPILSAPRTKLSPQPPAHGPNTQSSPLNVLPFVKTPQRSSQSRVSGWNKDKS